LGGLHRNTFLNSPALCDETLRLKVLPRLRFAGQITGCEGYVESSAIGLLVGMFAANERLGQAITPPPSTTAMGALLGHLTGGANEETFQPMNVNFGLFPPLDTDDLPKKQRPRGRDRKKVLSDRAKVDLGNWFEGLG
jgi:methylenetetrahydrofolate--tRNA-(uracil-5-)-methyltransferase